VRLIPVIRYLTLDTHRAFRYLAFFCDAAAATAAVAAKGRLHLGQSVKKKVRSMPAVRAFFPWSFSL
jgi:hypothetical protein